MANVIPIFKKGNTMEPDNYRPISLTSVLCKIMESIIKDAITQHLISNNLLSQAQFGFRTKRSCILQLLEAMDYWTEVLDKGLPVDVVYFDFKKAFDSVPHRKLLQKVKAYGIRGQLLMWIRDFLSDRRQRVSIEDIKSDWIKILSGVPQGSVLGPLLFLIFINDLPEVVECCIKLFADDTKLYSILSNNFDYERMKRDTQRMMDWSTTWQLGFNSNKCKVVHLGRKNEGKQYIVSNNGIDTNLSDSNGERDLGVLVDSELSFGKHITNIVNKANRQLGLIKRTFIIRDRHTLTMIYKSMIRPLLEYASPVWSPWRKKDITRIEQVQRRFTRLVEGTRGMNYEQRLNFLRLPSLAYRRDREQLIQVFKMLNGLYDVGEFAFFQKAHANNTRGHHLKLQTIRACTNRRAEFFSVKVIGTWNALPEMVVSAGSLNQFKNRMDYHLKDQQHLV